MKPRHTLFIRHLTIKRAFTTHPRRSFHVRDDGNNTFTVQTFDDRFTPPPITCEPLFHHLKSLDLHTLSLWSEPAAPVLEHLFQHTDILPRLKALEVYSTDPDSRPWLPQFASRSRVEELSIRPDFWPLESIMTLVRWPQRLRKLDFAMCWCSLAAQPPHELLETPSLQQMLDIHSKTLEHIKLGVWEGNIGTWHENRDPRLTEMVDLLAYPNLKRLGLAEANIFHWSPAHVSSKLPEHLTHLDIEYDTAHEDGQSWTEEKQISWLEQFFTLRRRMLPNHQLRHLYVDCRFGDEAISHDYLGRIEDTPWPGEHFNVAATALERFNVSLTYPKPYIGEAEWHTMIADQTVPGYEYDTTKEERLAATPAMVDEYLAFYEDLYREDPERRQTHQESKADQKRWIKNKEKNGFRYDHDLHRLEKIGKAYGKA